VKLHLSIFQDAIGIFFSHWINSSAAVQHANPGFRAAQPPFDHIIPARRSPAAGQVADSVMQFQCSAVYYKRLHRIHFLLDKEHQQSFRKHSDF